mgnify:CR=1 FL=1
MMTLHLGRDTVNLVQTPMFHAASMFGVLGGPAVGAHSVIVPLFDPKAVMAAVDLYKPTITVMVPTMIGLVMGHPEFTPAGLGSFTDLVYGASPMPQALLEKVLALYPTTNIWQAYGMTEASSAVSMLGPKEHREGGELLRSAGMPFPGVVVSIQDEEGNRLLPGEVGEVCVQGGNYMIGYWNKPDATAEAFRGGWFHSGELGRLDEEGCYYIVDRLKEMIIRGGFNVYPREIEEYLLTHPKVSLVAVVGVPDERLGEEVKAYVVLKEGQSATVAEIIEFAKIGLADYKYPRQIEFRTTFPMTATGKILKRELIES